MTLKEAWTYQLDWLAIMRILGLEAISDIPEFKKEKAIKKMSKQYGDELLNSLTPHELDELMANELRDIMKKELIIIEKVKEKQERDLRNKIAPFNKAGVIGLDMDPEDFMKFFNKTMRRGDDDEDNDDDGDRNDDDKNGYYI